MKKLFILAACALLVAATSCGSDNKEDEIINGGTQGGSTSGEIIPARYIEFCETKGASIEEVKRYMSKEAGDLWVHQEEQSTATVKTTTLFYTFEDVEHTKGDAKEFGVYMYGFNSGKLFMVSVQLPSYQMCYDGLKVHHELVKEFSMEEGKAAYFKTRDGLHDIHLTEYIVNTLHMGIITCTMF